MLSNQLRDQLQKYGQTHILAFYDELNETEKQILEKQIERIDFEALSGLFALTQNPQNAENGTIEPIPCTVKANLSDAEYQKYYQKGLSLMREGNYAVVTMAGGQGTRLGHTGPKGTFSLCLPEEISLFEIQCKRLLARSAECGKTIPWYIMTSEENDAETKRFFAAHHYFGYPQEDICFFTQFMLPMLDTAGKLILEEKYSLKEGADGHGGIFKAMLKHGVIDDMRKRGVQWIFAGGIDNVLVRMEDPCFVGFLAEKGYALGGKSILKRDPYEKAGVFCKKDGRPFVVEYTEISSEMAEQTDSAGDYVYGDAHILCNLFRIDVFEKMGSEGLPYHVAFKKAPYVDASGCKIIPETPNAYKFEAFLFDAFAFYTDMGILRVERAQEFAPVKNKTGEDSPETAQALYLADAAQKGEACR